MSNHNTETTIRCAACGLAIDPTTRWPHPRALRTIKIELDLTTGRQQPVTIHRVCEQLWHAQQRAHNNQLPNPTSKRW